MPSTTLGTPLRCSCIALLPATHVSICSFWKNLSGHFIWFVCNHSYGYVFQRIEQTDSLSDVEKNMAQNSAFL